MKFNPLDHGKQFGTKNFTNGHGNNSNNHGGKANFLWNRKRKIEFPVSSNGGGQPLKQVSNHLRLTDTLEWLPS